MTPADPPARQLERYLERSWATVAATSSSRSARHRRRRNERRSISIRRLGRGRTGDPSLSPRTDVYCGVLLRSHRAGGRDAVTSSHLAWVEIDAVDALHRTGGSPGRRE